MNDYFTNTVRHYELRTFVNIPLSTSLDRGVKLVWIELPHLYLDDKFDRMFADGLVAKSNKAPLIILALQTKQSRYLNSSAFHEITRKFNLARACTCMNRPGCQTHFEVRIYYHNASLHSLKKCEEPQSKYDAKTFGAIWSRFVLEWLRSSGLEGKYTFLSDARDFESACLDDAEDNEDVQVSTHLGLNRTVTRHTPSLEIAPENQTNASLDMRCRPPSSERTEGR